MVTDKGWRPTDALVAVQQSGVQELTNPRQE
jgi:hypothetical protein